MAEDRWRCRYWPECWIHTGEGRLLVHVPRDEREEIRRKYEAGVRRRVLVEEHGLTREQIYRLTS